MPLAILLLYENVKGGRDNNDFYCTHAGKAEKAGVDRIICQGFEAGYYSHT